MKWADKKAVRPYDDDFLVGSLRPRLEMAMNGPEPASGGAARRVWTRPSAGRNAGVCQRASVRVRNEQLNLVVLVASTTSLRNQGGAAFADFVLGSELDFREGGVYGSQRKELPKEISWVGGTVVDLRDEKQRVQARSSLGRWRTEVLVAGVRRGRLLPSSSDVYGSSLPRRHGSITRELLDGRGKSTPNNQDNQQCFGNSTNTQVS